MKYTTIYSIAPNYRSCTVWLGSPMTRARIGTRKLTPNKGLSREERHAEIAAWLYREFNIPGPAFQAKG